MYTYRVNNDSDINDVRWFVCCDVLDDEHAFDPTDVEFFIQGQEECHPYNKYSRYYIEDNILKVETNTEKLREFNKAESKKVKEDDVSAIIVTTLSGKVFNGDETSQDRMLRAIQIAEITSQTTTDWKMADNSIVEVTLAELKEALALAGQAMSDIWLAE